MQVHNITFGANYIKDASIKKKNWKGFFEPYSVKMLEFNPKSKDDIKAVNDVVWPWGGFRSFSYEIAENMSDILEGLNRSSSYKFYALTQQKKDFEQLNPKDILSLVQIIDNGKDRIKISFLETNPKYAYASKNSIFKHIGSAMLNAIESMFENRDFYINATDESIPFYEKCGYVKTVENTNEMAKKRG